MSSSFNERWLSQLSQDSHTADSAQKHAHTPPESGKSQEYQRDTGSNTKEVVYNTSSSSRVSEPRESAKAAKTAKVARKPRNPSAELSQPGCESSAKVIDLQAERGPCYRCGHPVTWQNGLRNWFGDLVHLTCPEEFEQGEI
jgi:hypothetical protein